MRTGLHHLVRDQVETNGALPALTYKNATLNYSEFWARITGFASGLHARGVGREDRVGIFLDKRIETATAIFGTSAAGGVFVPINPLLKPAQVAYILKDCGVRVLITSPERYSLLAAHLGECPTVEHVVLTAPLPTPHPEPAGHAVSDWTSFDRGETSVRETTTSIDMDMASILYTSGSTGMPKGVVLSHRNMIVGAESVAEYLGNRSDDVILSALPLSFDAGLSQLTTAFSVGAHVVLMNYLVPADVVRLCARHGVTGLTCVPPLWIQIAEQEWPAEASAKLRYFANTGGRMPKQVLDQLRCQFPDAKPYLMYGLTEAFRSTYLDPREVDRRPDSIGKAIPNAEILVVRPDGSVCDAGEEGELVHRGALVAMGYWGDEQRTAERFRPAPGAVATWRAPEIAVWSGDAVVRDAEGFLYFVGRKDDMIKTSGYRVSPGEVEEIARATGLVRDAVALGVSDAKLGQRIVMVASPTDPTTIDESSLLTAMRKNLPLFMMPAQVRFLPDLPRSPNGKVDRAALRIEFGS